MVSDEVRPLSERVTAAARCIEDQASELEQPETYARRDTAWTREVMDPLKQLNGEAEERLRRHDFLEERAGAECTRLETWKERRNKTVDEPLYLYLLRDCIECHFLFYKHFHMYRDDDAFRDAVTDDQVGRRSEHNTVATLTWLEQIEAPTRLASRQTPLAAYTEGQVG